MKTMEISTRKAKARRKESIFLTNRDYSALARIIDERTFDKPQGHTFTTAALPVTIQGHSGTFHFNTLGYDGDNREPRTMILSAQININTPTDFSIHTLRAFFDRY